MSRVLGRALVLFAACTDAPAGPPGPSTQPTRIDLHAATGIADLKPVGVTVDPAGTRFFLDENLGLFAFGADGRAAPVMSQEALTVIKTPAIELPYTDILAVAPDQFALTAIGDGFLLDTAAGTLTQHFCYVPDGTPSWLWQRTDALAYDAAGDLIYAQPRTYDIEGVLQSTAIGTYDRVTGDLVDWFLLSEHTFAGAMLVTPDRRIFAGEGATLKRYVHGEYRLTPVLSFAELGVRSIDGLALDGDTLLILDGADDALWELAASEL